MPLINITPYHKVNVGWESVTQNNVIPFSAPTSGFSQMWAISADEILIHTGGTGANGQQVATFNLTTGLWTLKTSLPQDATVGMGALHPTSGNPIIGAVSAVAGDILEYNPGGDTWSVVATLPGGRYHRGGIMANLGNGDVVFAQSIYDAVQSDYVTSWNGVGFTLEADIPHTPIQTSNYGNIFGSSNGYLYLISTRAYGPFVATDIVYRYHLGTGLWSTAANNMPEPHLQSIVVPLDGTRALVMGGGETGAGGSSDKVYIFDSTTETFTSFAGIRTPENPLPLPTSYNVGSATKMPDGRVITFQLDNELWITTGAV